MVKFSIAINHKSHLSLSRIINMIGIQRSKYYDWRNRLGVENNHNGKLPKQHWLTPDEKNAIIEYAQKYIHSHQYYLQDGYRRITYLGIDENVFACSPSSVYRVLSKAGLLSKWKNRKNSNKGKGYNIISC